MSDKKPKRKRRRRKARGIQKRTIIGVCRDCSLHQPTDRIAFYRAALPRCTGCGGVLDRLGHLMRMRANEDRD